MNHCFMESELNFFFFVVFLGKSSYEVLKKPFKTILSQ